MNPLSSMQLPPSSTLLSGFRIQTHTSHPAIWSLIDPFVPRSEIRCPPLSSVGVVSKLVHATVRAVPGVAIGGGKRVRVGAPPGAVTTVKGCVLVAAPVGVVTATGPVVAVAGTVATSWVGLAVVTAAA